LNNIVIDLDTDFWLYISRDLFFEQPKEGEVGSSTMPHKVNPINFENSEGNMMVSNSLLTMFSNKLTRSRMQRDLSDSTVTRNIGVGLSHSYLAIEETIKGLNKIAINKNKCIEELDNSPELLAEPIQTVLKTAGINDPYTLLKNFTRGKKVSKKDLDNFIDNIDGVDKNVKDSLLNLDVRNYTGYAERICNEVLDNTKKELEL
jgi:adenylosuccinate lyase